jgi:microcystin-dependent protein
MSCKDCFNNCPEGPLSDQCVKYTGEDNTVLGIKTGQSLYTVEKAIIEYIVSLADGTGISLDITSGCSLLTTLINSDTSLENVLQAYADAICSLKSSVDGLTPETASYDAGCLTLPDDPTTADVVQALVTKACSIDTRVTEIEENYVKNGDVITIVQNYISGSNSSAQEYTKMAKYVAYDYHGPLSNFDSSGKGLSSAGYDKVYLCLGQTVNGFTLPDYRGRSSVMINVNVPGGAMDSAVDPALAANASYQITLNSKKGSFTHSLSSVENGSHTHTVTDAGHKHWATVKSRDFKNEAGTGSDYTSDGGDSRSFETSIAYTGISIASSGSGQPHNNLQPSVGSIKMMYVP